MSAKMWGSIFAVMLAPMQAQAAEWHVAADGTADGDGSGAAPWDLATAWAHPEGVMPGDTIWLHGGTYPVVGATDSQLIGTAEAPIVVRGAVGERVTFDTGDSHENRVSIGGHFTWYWDFEVTSSSEDRFADDGQNADRGNSIDVGAGQGIKLINLVVHDTQSAIGFWSAVTAESEVYGCLIYFNGYDAADRGHGHAIYTQNEAGPKYLRDNIMFAQYSFGIHAYTEGGQINDFVIEGNVSFENGSISTISGRKANILVGGAPVAQNPQLRENYGWMASDGGGRSCDLAYGSGTANAIVEDNVFRAGDSSFGIAGAPSNIAGNVFVGPTNGLDAGAWPDNELYPDTVPTGAAAFVRPNAYDPDRAHVVVFNWELRETVDVDLSPLLHVGDGFELRDAQNYYGDPVLTGTYDGPVAIPMTPGPAATVVGTPATAYVHSSAEFGAFVLFRTEAGDGGSESESGVVEESGGDAGSTTASATDGGSDSGTGTDAADGGSSGASAGQSDDGGCSCNSPGRMLTPWLLIPLMALGRRRSS